MPVSSSVLSLVRPPLVVVDLAPVSVPTKLLIAIVSLGGVLATVAVTAEGDVLALAVLLLTLPAAWVFLPTRLLERCDVTFGAKLPPAAPVVVPATPCCDVASSGLRLRHRDRGAKRRSAIDLENKPSQKLDMFLTHFKFTGSNHPGWPAALGNFETRPYLTTIAAARLFENNINFFVCLHDPDERR